MSKKLSEYSIDELLLMQKSKFLKLLQKTVEEIRYLLYYMDENHEDLNSNGKTKQ